MSRTPVSTLGGVSNWVPTRNDFKDRLISFGSGDATQWILSRINEGELLVTDAQGKLLRRQLASGQSVTVGYGAGTGKPSSLTDDFGRTIATNYADVAGSQLLSSVVDPAGNVVSYAYNSASQLSGFTYPDGRSKTYLWDEPSFSSGSAPAGGKLTGIVDEQGVRYTTFTYANGFAVGSEHALGTDKYQINDSRTGLPLVGNVNVTYPTGASFTSVYADVIGQSRAVSDTQPAGSGCTAANSFRSFDGNGNLASSVDLDGHQSCFVSDLNTNFPIVRVEGLAGGASCAVTSAGASLPAGSRKTSTQWHPDWRLASRVAEPGRITTSVYNGQPDPFAGGALASCAPSTATLQDGKPIAVLCREVQQATTDVDGSQGFSAQAQAGVAVREQRWSYNQLGQMLSATDPLGHTTTFAYYGDTAFTGSNPTAVGHTAGDLSTETNPAGHVTRYTAYNKTGQVLQSVDPNGVVTTHQYDARQRLISTSTGGQTTTLAYWPTGLLQSMTRPDGSSLSYGYDDAHRLIQVSDNLGNSVSYTLDNAGNRIAEAVRDPSLTLRRSLGRSVDALGRVQQITGRL